MKDTGRVLATGVVWAGVACSLVFGVYAISWAGIAGILGICVATVVLASAGTVATSAIWKGAGSDH